MIKDNSSLADHNAFQFHTTDLNVCFLLTFKCSLSPRNILFVGCLSIGATVILPSKTRSWFLTQT